MGADDFAKQIELPDTAERAAGSLFDAAATEAVTA